MLAAGVKTSRPPLAPLFVIVKSAAVVGSNTHIFEDVSTQQEHQVSGERIERWHAKQAAQCSEAGLQVDIRLGNRCAFVRC